MSASTPTRRRAPQARETADVQRYLRALFDRERPGALIELRSRYEHAHLQVNPGDQTGRTGPLQALATPHPPETYFCRK